MKKTNPPIYQAMLELPLIKGVSLTRITEIVGRYRLNFIKYQPGDVIVHAGTPCSELRFVLSGAARLSVSDPDGDISIEQTLTAPDVIAPDRLFGRTTVYPCTAKAISTTGIMEIPKEEFRKMLASDSVILYNYLNALSSASQRVPQWLSARTIGSPAQKIAYYVSTMSQPGSTDITVKSSTSDLHTLFGISLSAWRNAMDRLQAAGLVTDISATGFRVPSRAPLAAMLM